ncbi:MAG: polyprenyl synthetase family protein [Bacteriovoracaceae bacterium]
MLLQAIKTSLKSAGHHPELYKILDYAVLPAGKLFRPKLVEAIALDLGPQITQDHLHLAAAVEIHHAYTLVHDDLPAMDNDQYRRGKLSTHAAFNEWKAILTGDALLIHSFNELNKIENENYRFLLRFFSWATGAKGLILGQFLDLGAEGQANLRDIVRIHELKTARLIQVATVGSYLLTKDFKFQEFKDYFKLGNTIGVSFQLLDDLNELTEETVSSHEKEINPFLLYSEDALSTLSKCLEGLYSILKKKNLTHTSAMMKSYLEKNQKNFKENKDILLGHFDDDQFKRKLENWITNFVSL